MLNSLTESSSRYFYWDNFEIYELNSMPICASMVDLYDFAKTQKQVSWKGNTIKDFIVCYDENM